MSIIVDFFITSDDGTAATALAGGPEAADFETVKWGNFMAYDALLEWETILLGRTEAEHEAAEAPRVIGVEEPDGAWIFAVPPEFLAALTAADRDRLAEIASLWIAEYSEDHGGFDLDTACGILWSLADLGRSAVKQGYGLYCWTG